MKPNEVWYDIEADQFGVYATAAEMRKWFPVFIEGSYKYFISINQQGIPMPHAIHHSLIGTRWVKVGKL